ncbi:uncharacterized protein [Diadema setosum]|uniref:uncharacterized protein n=1 Tax=Diadema setosum TaxID=31175 RepID=UPI003B3BB7CA
MEQLHPPKQLDFEATNLSREWKQWKEEFFLYVSLAMDGKTEQMKVQMLKYLIGPRGREVYQKVKPAKETLQSALDALGKHCDPPKNETLNRYRFFTRKQEVGESFDSFLTELQLLAEQCNFKDLRDSLIRDRIICGLRENATRKRLLRRSALTLDKCIKACRAAELSKKDAVLLDGDQSTEVHALKLKGKDAKLKRGKNPRAKLCQYGGRQHTMQKEKCPVYGKKCTRRGRHSEDSKSEQELKTVTEMLNPRRSGRRNYSKERFERALELVREGVSCRKAALRCGVPKTTLLDRLRGRSKSSENPGRGTILPQEVEKALVDHLMELSSHGHSLTKTQVLLMAADIADVLGRRPSSQKGRLLSSRWLMELKRRWPALQLTWPSRQERNRARSTNLVFLTSYSSELKRVMDKYRRTNNPSNIDNMEETASNADLHPPWDVGQASVRDQQT